MKTDSGYAPYAVTAYLWGMRDAHSYVVGVVTDLTVAKMLADQTVDDRGGKYSCEVCDAEGDQVYYNETPYFGCAGRFRAACDPANRSLPIEQQVAFIRRGTWRSILWQICRDIKMIVRTWRDRA